MNHTLAWLVWAMSAAVATLVTRNPFYLAIIALSAWMAYITAGQGSGLAQSWAGLVRLGAFIWLLAVPFNALMFHQGTHVLFRLPANWPLVGGNITLEATLYGLASGFSLWALLLVFVSFNVAVDASQLLRLVPSFLYQAGVITSIALTFMPQMLSSAKEIHEAQQIRGHRFRGYRDLLPLVVPLLTTGFERAIELAESMEARGFGGQLAGLTARALNGMRLSLLTGLALLLGGLLLRTYWLAAPWFGSLVIAGATLLLLYTFALLGRHVQRSHYRRMGWKRSDTAIAVVSIAVLGATLLVRSIDKLALVYYPFPPYPLAPEFNPWIGAALAFLVLPGVVRLFGDAGAPREGVPVSGDTP
jgi:energy-coupling factor transport system permease protein